jgi:primary-amine oxidase
LNPLTAVSSGDERNGTLVCPNVVGMNHQHWFALRLNFDIDGERNAVVENNVVRDTQGNQSGHFQTVERTIFGRAEDAKRDVDDEHSRTWTIYNPQSVNRFNRPAGYDLVPMGNTLTAFAKPRETGPAGFTFHHLWVTPYREGELFPDGAYPTNAGPDYSDTIYHFAGADPIFDRDIVVWYVFGATHVPRAEDYPLMPSLRMSVEFRPSGFFDRNPALPAATESR